MNQQKETIDIAIPAPAEKNMSFWISTFIPYVGIIDPFQYFVTESHICS